MDIYLHVLRRDFNGGYGIHGALKDVKDYESSPKLCIEELAFRFD